ncbi:MAG: TonB-dependent receptor [Melioribacteraceae bacterium]
MFDIKMNDGSKKEASIYGGIGLISSRLAIEAPIIKDKMSLILLGRRTYLDLFLPLIPRDEGVQENSSIYFYDFNTKLNAILGENDRLFLSGYFGKDVANLGDEGSVKWGNTTGTIRWNHIFSNKIFSNTTFLYSDFNFDLGVSEGKSLVEINSGIKDLSLKTDFQYYLNNENNFKFGIHGVKHTFNPGKISEGNKDDKYESFEIKNIHALEGNLYASHEYKFSNRLKLEYGIRYSNFSIIGPGEYFNFTKTGEIIDTSIYKSGEIAKTYHGIEPRISFNYFLDISSSIKLSYARNRQNIHLLTNSSSGTPIDRWQPSTPLIKPEISDQISVGYFKNFKNSAYEFSAELYYKDLKNQVDYKNGADLVLNEFVEADLVFGTGRAYGMELYLKKNLGKFTGWVSYTLSRVEKKFVEINKGKLFPAKQDKTHDLSLVGVYNMNEDWTFSATWVYSTGNAVTFPSGKYSIGGKTTTYYTERNGYRMPAYHRLDIGATWHFGEDSDLTFSVYNAYGRTNAYSITFREAKSDPSKTEAVKLALFKYVPSITYNFRF